MNKLCSIVQIILLWFQKCIVLFQAERINSDIMSVYQQLDKVKSA